MIQQLPEEKKKKRAGKRKKKTRDTYIHTYVDTAIVCSVCAQKMPVNFRGVWGRQGHDGRAVFFFFFLIRNRSKPYGALSPPFPPGFKRQIENVKI